MRLHHATSCFAFAACTALTAVAQNQTWIRQFGSNNTDAAVGASQDGLGGMYACGRTMGSVAGASAGDVDAWFAHYDDTGTRTWIRQIGTSLADEAVGVAPDASNGVYVVGSTLGNLGGPNAGDRDAWFARYDASGVQLWIHQLGTSHDDRAWAAASDGSGGVYVAGNTGGNLGGSNVGYDDGWVARYDASGNQLWIRQIGTSGGDGLLAAAPDGSGGVFVGGNQDNNAWLAHIDGAGNVSWNRYFAVAVSWTLTQAATPDGSGGVYLCGVTNGTYVGGYFEAWLARYDITGAQLWIRQLGTNFDDSAYAAAFDATGGVYIAGATSGTLGAASAGYEDAWLARYDALGNQSWLRQFGTTGDERAYAAAPAPQGGVFIAGRTSGSLGGVISGNFDAWVAAYDVQCGATFNYCTAGATTNGCVPSISGAGTPSASASSGFTISVASVEGQRQGLIFYGIDNLGFAPAPWGVGFLCIKAPLQRTPAQNSGGTISLCDGTLALDWNAFRASHLGALGAPFAAGRHVYVQGWFRDPASAKTTSLSDALGFTLCP